MNLDAFRSKRRGRPRFSKNGFTRFLEFEAEKNPLRIEGCINHEEVLMEAELLADRMIDEDLKLIRKFWEDRNFELIVSMLRKYGLEFKGVIYTEHLIREFLRIVRRREDFEESKGEDASC